eukprot:TRINITY_DN8278_c0_g1_i1.p1 TRINITY_DN8278_c0_g1~~TRINITY_DN8278_c0_g1_i1.p1  ORF type:complete len:109 (-),score=13.67 TRINITY_DN8278_c0_g1_i1:112-438(-)
MFVFVYVLCGGVNLCMVLFLVFHGYLLLTNQSTIEVCGNKLDTQPWHKLGVSNPYDIGAYKNITEVFGNREWYTWLWPGYVDPPGNGMIYRVCDRVQDHLGLQYSLNT